MHLQIRRDKLAREEYVSQPLIEAAMFCRPRFWQLQLVGWLLVSEA
jgi:hypothetical protein